MTLRRILFLDALTCLGCGALMSLASGPLGTLLSLPAGLLLYAGLSLLPIAAFMGFVGARATQSALAVWLVVLGNALWVFASIGLLVSDAVSPNLLGKLFIGGQAAVVLLLTVLEAENVPRTQRRVGPLTPAR